MNSGFLFSSVFWSKGAGHQGYDQYYTLSKKGRHQVGRGDTGAREVWKVLEQLNILPLITCVRNAAACVSSAFWKKKKNWLSWICLDFIGSGPVSYTKAHDYTHTLTHTQGTL